MASALTICEGEGLDVDAGTLKLDGNQKVGFFGTAPAAQRAAYVQTYAIADRTHDAPTATVLVHSAVGGVANGTLVDCTASYSEAAVEENFKELATAFNLLLADVADLKQLVNSVIDDLQALGLAT